MKKSIGFKKEYWMLFVAILLLFVFCNANFVSVLPFGYGFAFSLVANNFYSIIIIVFYFFASIIHQLNFAGLVESSLVCALLLIYLLFNKIYKKPNVLILLFFCAFSRVANIYFSFTNLYSIIFSIVDLVVGIFFCYLSYRVINAIKYRGFQCFTRVEKYFVCLMIISCFCGLTNLFLFIDFSKLFFILAILVSSVAIKEKTVFLACFICVAYALSTLNLFACLPLFVFACAASWLSSYNKFLSASAVCLVDAIFGLFLDYGLIDLVPAIIASTIFVLIPQKLIKKVSNYITGSKNNIIAGYYVNKKQENIKTKLINMGSLFKQMQKCYRDLLIGEANETKLAIMFSSEVRSEICENCINKLGCADKNLSLCFEELALRAQKRGKVNLLDVPPLLSSNCSKINACLSSINQKAGEYLSQAKKIKAEDDNKLNISLQLGGTSKIFTELSNQFSVCDKVNNKKSLQLKDSLQSKSVVCKECVVTENQNGVFEILLVVRNADTVNPEILISCEKIFNMMFERKMCFQTKIAGWSLLCVVPSNRYELLCGYASTPKNVGDKNGDNYVFTKLTDNKYLVAICDGMGHGEKANAISSVAINLIESYYKCGLSSQIVLDSVNNLLLPAQEKGFTTLDATIVDTKTGEVDFIKIGSTISIVKQSETSKIVSVESLPLGVVEGIVPTTQKEILFSGDIVVLVSDGIADVFSSQEEFCNFVNNENIINMQMFAESILEEATARQTQIRDDMTVIAYRLVQKR